MTLSLLIFGLKSLLCNPKCPVTIFGICLKQKCSSFIFFLLLFSLTGASWVLKKPQAFPELFHKRDWMTCISFVGQKPVLTDVQAELDRISRKPDMVSPTTPTSPTEGEASWRHQIKPIFQFSGIIQTCLCLFLQWLELKNWKIFSEHKQFMSVFLSCVAQLNKRELYRWKMVSHHVGLLFTVQE